MEEERFSYQLAWKLRHGARRVKLGRVVTNVYPRWYCDKRIVAFLFGVETDSLAHMIEACSKMRSRKFNVGDTSNEKTRYK